MVTGFGIENAVERLSQRCPRDVPPSNQRAPCSYDSAWKRGSDSLSVQNE
jgi:hypothetical protein